MTVLRRIGTARAAQLRPPLPDAVDAVDPQRLTVGLNGNASSFFSWYNALARVSHADVRSSRSDPLSRFAGVISRMKSSSIAMQYCSIDLLMVCRCSVHKSA